jgi:hypothetical protein
MIIGRAAGIYVITIARKGFWGKFIPPRFLDYGYCYLLFPELVNRNTKAAWSVHCDRTFQVANRKSFFRLLSVFIVLICPIFFSFSFVIRVFPLDGELAHCRATYTGGHS